MNSLDHIMEFPKVIDRHYSSLVLCWPIPKQTIFSHNSSNNLVHNNTSSNPIIYELQIYDHLNDDWKTLSNTIQSNTIKKNNLIPSIGYRFRIRFRFKDNEIWSEYSPSSEEYYVLSPEFQMMKPPILFKNDDVSVTLQWEPCLQDNVIGYLLRYRDDYEQFLWQSVPTIIQGNTVRKKGLIADRNYYFSIMPVVDEAIKTTTDSVAINWSFSVSSDPYNVAKLSDYIKNLLPKEMLIKSQSTAVIATTSSILSGIKCIAIYFSAKWCGPCRQFTPILQELYHSSKLHKKSFEIIFCSADHDQDGFSAYYSSMPWVAIKFDDTLRESLMANFKVSGIPRLCILSANSGRIIVDNAAGGPITLAMIDNWIALC